MGGLFLCITLWTYFFAVKLNRYQVSCPNISTVGWYMTIALLLIDFSLNFCSTNPRLITMPESCAVYFQVPPSTLQKTDLPLPLQEILPSFIMNLFPVKKRKLSSDSQGSSPVLGTSVKLGSGGICIWILFNCQVELTNCSSIDNGGGGASSLLQLLKVNSNKNTYIDCFIWWGLHEFDFLR